MNNHLATTITVDEFEMTRFNTRPVFAIDVRVTDPESVAGVCTALRPAIEASSHLLGLFNLGKLYYAWRHARKHAPIQSESRVPSDQPSGYDYLDATELAKLQTIAESWWYQWIGQSVVDVAASDMCEMITNYEVGSKAQRTMCEAVREAHGEFEASLSKLVVIIEDDIANEIVRVVFREDGNYTTIRLQLGAPSDQLINPFQESFSRLESLLDHCTCGTSMIHKAQGLFPVGQRAVLITTPYLKVSRGGTTAYTASLQNLSEQGAGWHTDDCEGILNPFGKIDLFKLLIKPEDVAIIRQFESGYGMVLDQAMQKYAMVAELFGPDFIN